MTYLSSDIRDELPLTPNHFLYGHQGHPFVPEGVDETRYMQCRRWGRIQELVVHVWKMWMKEIVPQLNRRMKWKKEEKNLKVGDVVVVITPETTRGHWPLGRVEEIFPGKDGYVRVVHNHLAGKSYIRPIHRLCKLLTFTDD